MAKSKNRNLLIKIGIPLTLLAIVLPVSLYAYSVIGNDNTYKEMIEKMENISYLSDLDLVRNSLDSLPSDYKDTPQIRIELQLINKELDIIKKGNILKDYKKMREAYYNLEALNSSLYTWSLFDFFNNQNPLITLAGSYYSLNYPEGDYFKLEPCGSSEGFCLTTNLPNDKDPNKSYYYLNDEDYRVFSYQNMNNTSEVFEAFRIVEVSEVGIKVYSYKNKITYSLSRNDNN